MVIRQTGCSAYVRERSSYGPGRHLTISGPAERMQEAIDLAHRYIRASSNDAAAVPYGGMRNKGKSSHMHKGKAFGKSLVPRHISMRQHSSLVETAAMQQATLARQQFLTERILGLPLSRPPMVHTMLGWL